jgi:hypothetical protein
VVVGLPHMSWADLEGQEKNVKENKISLKKYMFV